METKPEATVLSLTDLRFGERGEIFVVDGMSSCVFVFSQNGKFLRRIGTKGQGPGELRNPGGIALSRDGRIYVSDAGNARISIFTADGKYVNSVKLSRPGTHLEVNGGGNFYLLGSGSWSVVHKFDPGGKFLASFGEPPEQLRRLGLPISGGSLDVDDAGNCYYVHVAQYAIQKYSPQGKLLKVFTRHAPFYQPLTRTPQPGETMKSWYDSWTPIFKIVVLKRGMVLIQIRTAKSGSELYENMIDIFDTEGNFLTGGLYNTYRLMGRDEDDHLIFAERQEPQSLEFIPNPRIIRFFLQVNDGVDS